MIRPCHYVMIFTVPGNAAAIDSATLVVLFKSPGRRELIGSVNALFFSEPKATSPHTAY